MANPQKENGYTAIANEIMEALAKTRIPGQARQVLDFILRKTYGWNKKESVVSLPEFVEGTGLSKVAICKSLNKLLDMNIITKLGNAKSHFTKLGNDYSITYGFQKQYKLWKTLPKKVTFFSRYPKRKSTLPKKVTPPLNTKKIKQIPLEIYNFYKTEINPLKKSSTRAKENITYYLKKYSKEQLIASIKNYKTVCKDDEPKYKKDPANFFGKNDRYFIDYLPENFEPPKKEAEDPFKGCDN